VLYVIQVLMLLRRAGGDVNVLNNLGVTPLAYTCMFPLSVEVSLTCSKISHVVVHTHTMLHGVSKAIHCSHLLSSAGVPDTPTIRNVHVYVVYIVQNILICVACSADCSMNVLCRRMAVDQWRISS
jgi:hypothetical protein